jgi:hypothetical protein
MGMGALAKRGGGLNGAPARRQFMDPIGDSGDAGMSTARRSVLRNERHA